jgi:hypothetical protein
MGWFLSRTLTWGLASRGSCLAFHYDGYRRNGMMDREEKASAAPERP